MPDAGLEFAEGSFGFNKDITLYNTDGTLADLTGYTSATLTIEDEEGSVKLSVALTLPGGSVARWAVNSGNTNYNGNYIGQVKLTGAGKEDRTYLFPVKVTKRLD